MKRLLILFGLGLTHSVQAQQAAADTTKVLQEITIHGYQHDRPLDEVPAAVGVVTEKTLQRASTTSILPIVNSIPGVRMEERSPGSYRFSVRGSLLRSPFGVRNVKMYWNGLPLTDGGGNTYLNLIDFNSISSAEILKGPGASLYGASTGGVMLLNSGEPVPMLQISALGGSFGLQRYNLLASAGSDKLGATVRYAHQEADGYREQTAMRRDAANVDVNFATGSKGTLRTSLFYTDLFYETPGGLTEAQFKENPKQARPGTQTMPGAVDQQAAIYNKTVYGGVMHDYHITSRLKTQVGIYASYSDFKNPTIRNYEKRQETNYGARGIVQYTFEGAAVHGKLTAGVEYQDFHSPVRVYDNNRGIAGNIQTDDMLDSHQTLVFAQGEFELPSDFYLTAGASTNFLIYDYQNELSIPAAMQKRNFDPVFSPRVALLKKVSTVMSVYASVSKGFSPPSLAEVRPSTNKYNNTLAPEHGISYEAGLRGNAFGHQLLFDGAVYTFGLQETIVIQREDDGADYFVNAGKTRQFGVEGLITWDPSWLSTGALTDFRLWTSYTYNHYRFNDYVQDGVNYSGNALTGVAPVVFVTGLDVSLRMGLYLNVTANYTDHIPLNDANTAYAKEYMLLGSRLGYRRTFGDRLLADVFGGIDNALDKRYSLGNDLNAAGNRFYNAAPTRNFYFGVKLQGLFKRA